MRRPITALVMIIGIAAISFADEAVHVLQRGQTIYTLAGMYGVSAEELLRYNGIDDPTRLPVGARIRIPGTYTVQDGEYIYSIATKLGVNWLDLLEMNDLERNDVVRPGDVLLVPRDWAGDGSESAGLRVTSVTPITPEPADVGRVVDSPEPVAPDARVEWPHPGERALWEGGFPGVVMDGSPGDEFRSVASGVVSFVGPYTRFGILTFVQSENGYVYGYAGAGEVSVVQGQRVENGTVIGTIGVSPAFQSARVLLTVWRNNRYVDPAQAPRG